MALIYPSRRRSGFENMLKEQCLRQMQLQALTFFYGSGQRRWATTVGERWDQNACIGLHLPAAMGAAHMLGEPAARLPVLKELGLVCVCQGLSSLSLLLLKLG